MAGALLNLTTRDGFPTPLADVSKACGDVPTMVGTYIRSLLPNPTKPHTDRMERKTGRGVVLVILAAAASIMAIIVAGFIFFEPESQPCATGAMAENEFINGVYTPRQETFDNVRDAEAFICHSVPQLHADGWDLELINAERSHALAQTVDGNGTANVTLYYENDDLDRTLILISTPFFTEGGIPQPFTERDVTFGEYRGKLIRGGINPAVATVIWTDDTLQTFAVVPTDDAFTEDDLLEVLATAR